MFEKKSLHYLGSPFSHPNEEIRVFRLKAVTQMACDLIQQGLIIYSPLTHNFPLIQLGLVSSFEYWKTADLNLLSRCDKLLVFKLEGWEQSIGLQTEIKFAKENNIPVEFIESTPELLSKTFILSKVE